MQIFNKKIAGGPRQLQIDGDQFMIFKWMLFKAPLTAPTGVLVDDTELGLFVDPADNRLKVMKFGDQIVEIENILNDIQDLSNVTITSVADGDVLEYNSVSGQWENVPSASAGEANTGANVGASGAGVFRDKTTTVLNFRKLKPASGSGITITENLDDISFDFSTASLSNIPDTALNQITDKAKLPDDTFFATVTSPAVDDIVAFDGTKWINQSLGEILGEANTSDNIGIGANIFKIKEGIKLILRRLKTEDNKVTVIENPNDISLTIDESRFTHIPHAALDQITDRLKLPDDILYAAISQPQVDDVPVWNGSQWVNSPVPGGGAGSSDYGNVKPTGTIFGYWFGISGLAASGILDGQIIDWQPSTPQISGSTDLLDSNGPNRKFTGQDLGNKIGIQTIDAIFTRRYNADVTFRFKISTTDLDYRLYAGFIDRTSEDFTQDNELNEKTGFMFYKGATQTAFRIAHNDGDITQNEVNTSVNVDQFDHEVRLVGDETNSRWGWSIDGSSLSFVSSEIPGSDVPLAFFIAMELNDSVNRDLHIYYVKTRESMID